MIIDLVWKNNNEPTILLRIPKIKQNYFWATIYSTFWL